jgi:hypothetical protein
LRITGIRHGRNFPVFASPNVGRNTIFLVKHQTFCSRVNWKLPASSIPTTISSAYNSRNVDFETSQIQLQQCRGIISANTRASRQPAVLSFQTPKSTIILPFCPLQTSFARAACLTHPRLPSGTARPRWTAGTARRSLPRSRRNQSPAICCTLQSQLSIAAPCLSPALHSTTRPPPARQWCQVSCDFSLP